MAKPRRTSKKPGPAPLADKRDQYLRLMAQGMSISAACREVGINRRTGTQWRDGRKKSTGPGANASTRRSPRSGTSAGLRTGSCPRTSGSSSPTCSGPGPRCERSPGNSAGAQPRSAGRCAVIATRAPASTTLPGPAPSGRAPGTLEGGQDTARSGAEGVHPAASGPALEPGADQPGPAFGVPGGARAPLGARDHLPGDLSAAPRRSGANLRCPAHGPTHPPTPLAS